jgi:hypothetical protein
MRLTRLERLSSSAWSALGKSLRERMTSGLPDRSRYWSCASFRTLRSSSGLSAAPPQCAGKMASPKWPGRPIVTPDGWIVLRLTIILCLLLVIAYYVTN